MDSRLIVWAERLDLCKKQNITISIVCALRYKAAASDRFMRPVDAEMLGENCETIIGALLGEKT